MRARTLLVALLSLLAFGGARAAATKTAIPFHYVDNRIMLQCDVDGEPFTFLLDTGASTTSITPAVAKTLGLRAVDAGSTGGVGDATQSVARTTLRSVRVGDLTFANVSALVLDLSNIREHIGFPRLDGILGVDILQGFAVDVDSDRTTVTLSRQRLPRRAGARTVAFTGLLPHVAATIDGTPGTVVLDTGDRSSLTLFRGFAQRHGYYEAPRALRSALTGYGIGGPVYGDVFRLKHFDIFGTQLGDVLTRASRQRAGAFATMPEAGSVGGGILRRFNITYDYLHAQLSVAPSRYRRAPDPYDRSGMWIARQGTRIVVVAVTARGPARQAGVRAGDEIVSIDGRPVTGAQVIAERAFLATQPAGSAVAVVVRRGTVTVQKAIVLRMLV